MIEKIIKIYQQVYGKYIQNSRYKFNRSTRNKKYIENFIKLIDEKVGLESIDETFFWNFTLFQFEFFDGSDGKSDVDIQVNWIYGKKAFDRWLKRDMIHWEHFVDKFKIKYEIKILSIQQKTVNIEEGETVRKNNDRGRYYNTDDGFYYCNIMILFDKSNDICQKCKFFKDCKT